MLLHSYRSVIVFMLQAVGFVWGYVCQQFSQTMYILLAGVVLSCIVRQLLQFDWLLAVTSLTSFSIMGTIFVAATTTPITFHS